ncbi:MAG: hypothetical protein ACFB5Z_18455, partial [Elainellaceae cyanobacterium]
QPAPDPDPDPAPHPAPDPHPEPDPHPQPEPQPEPEPEPEVTSQNVLFPPNATGTIVSGRGAPNQIQRYRLRAAANQVLQAEVLRGDVVLTVRSPDGTILSGASGVSAIETRIPRAGDYQVDVVPEAPGPFMVDLSIVNLN